MLYDWHRLSDWIYKVFCVKSEYEDIICLLDKESGFVYNISSENLKISGGNKNETY